MFKCKYCNNEFETKKERGLHQRLCKFRPDYEEQIEKRRKGARITSKYNLGKQLVKHITFKVKCLKCKTEFEVSCTESEYNKGHYKHYCSRTCANSHIVTEETKQKIAEKLAKQKEIKTCKDCGIKISYKATYCKKCVNKHYNEFITKQGRIKLSDAGKHSAKLQSNIRRSKNEIDFCNLCQMQFKSVRHNESIFNSWDADIIIDDIKVAILWNGAWHYKKITKRHSLKQVQKRDEIKINEIKKSGYIPYVIKDMGKANYKKVLYEFNLFLENFSIERLQKE